MRKLLIVESPAKIKTISKFVGKEFVIMSTFGHVKDLPQNELGVTIADKNIELVYVPLPDKEKKISDICKAARQSDEVYLASDPDREGEIISWHIGQEIEKVLPKKSVMHRIVFNEITKSAVEKAIIDKRSIDMDKVNAQQARRILDRWVGYEVSPILWKKITTGLSAGRVQSVALMLICDRETAIEQFITEEYWSIHGFFQHKNDIFETELARVKGKKPKIKNTQEATALLNAVKKESYTVTDVADKERLKQPLPPFMTSTLQQDAYNKLGFSVDRTMSIAQKLYEGIPLRDKESPEALITYMRTDSLRLSETAITAARGYISSTYSDTYLPKTARQFEKAQKEGAQDAHEAVRPITVEFTPEYVAKYAPAECAKLYELIWRRFVASQMTPAIYAQRTAEVTGGEYVFRATGSTLLFDGFLKVYDVKEEEEEQNLAIPASIATGLPVTQSDVTSKQHFTKPPARYTQATLVKELEKLSIGRPSTYAATLSTIEKRKYVVFESKKFRPSELGRSVNALLTTNLPDIINVNFTAEMENSLDKIASGEIDRNKVLFTFYEKFSKDLAAFAQTDGKRKAVATDVPCPLCAKPLSIRFGKAGEFLGCTGFPACTFTGNFVRDDNGKISISDAAKPEAQKLDLTCPQCQKNLVQRVGKFGPFIACPGYPECKYIHQEKLSIPCEKCGAALIKRVSRGRTFWGCSAYPKCTFAIFSDVREQKCPQCKKSPYLLLAERKRQGEIVLSCPDKACGYTETEKTNVDE